MFKIVSNYIYVGNDLKLFDEKGMVIGQIVYIDKSGEYCLMRFDISGLHSGIKEDDEDNVIECENCN